MNRSVLARQMFAKGGAAGFPDLNKDGDITQADILMGRGVEFKQEGGIAGMMPEQPPAMAAGMAAGQAAMMPNPGAPAQQAAGVVDPAVIEQMLAGAVESGIGDLENIEDPEDMMNAIRGDEASVEERYAELAQVVGPEDAQQTPESVLALVQPVMMMSFVDQGIGELAQEEMSAPVEGAMAQGIMSTVPQPEPQPMPMEGAPPVNFKDGGLVRRGDNQPVQYYAKAGEVALPGTLRSGMRFPVNDLIRQNTLRNIDAAQEATANRALYSPEIAAVMPPIDKRGDGSRLRELVEGQRELYREYGLGDPESRAADLEEQKNLTQSQMLFDIANTALTFAGGIPGERPGMSAAERLAAAAVATKLPQTIGARAQAQREFERDLKKEGRTMDLAALQSAETKLAAEVAQEDALEIARAKPKKASFINVLDKTGTKNLGSPDISTAAGRAEAEKLLSENEGSFSTTNMPREPKEKDVVLYDVKTGAQSPIFDKNSEQGKADMQAWRKANPLPEGESYMMLKPPTAPTPDKPITERAFFDKFGFSFAAFEQLSPDMQNYVRGLPVLTNKDYFAKYGVTKEQFSALDQETQQFMMGLPVLTDKDYFSKYGMNKEEFMALPTETKNRLSRVEPDRKTVVVEGQIIDITEGKTPVAIFGDKTRKTLTVDGEVIDITDPNNVEVIYGDKKRDIRLVDGQLVEIKEGQETPVAIFGKKTPKNGTFENMILKNGDNIIVKKVGSTLYDVNGEVIDLATPQYEGAVLVSKDRAFADVKLARSQADASRRLRGLQQDQGDDFIARQISGSDDILGMQGGRNTSRVVLDALGAARKGVGFWSKLKQVFSEAGGAIVPALRDVAADEVEAGNFIDSINILGRVALANSPRIAEGEQQRLASLFPSTDNFLANPENAVRKLVGLKRLMREEYKTNLETLASSSDSTIRRKAEQQNHSIRGVLKLLETIPDRGFVSDTQFDETISGLVDMRNQRTGQ